MNREEILAKYKDNPELQRQLKLGLEFMERYREVFIALATNEPLKIDSEKNEF